MVRVGGPGRPAAGIGRWDGTLAGGGLAGDGSGADVDRMAAREPQTDRAWGRAEPAAAGVCAGGKTAAADAGVSVVAWSPAGANVAGFAAAGLSAGGV